MQRPPKILTIDVGTGSVRAGIVGLDGRVRALNAITHETTHPHHGWAEQRPEDWWQGACRAVAATLADVGTTDLAGVVCCGQMHAPVLIDGGGALVRNSVPLWNDKRAALIAPEIAAKIAAHSLPLPVNPPTSAWPGIKLAWSAVEDPSALSATRWLLMPKDWLNLRLTGEVAMDWTEAGSSYLSDSDTGTWSPDLARILGIDPAILPPILASTARLGTVSSAGARATGLPQGLPVFAGAGDFPVAILGSGVTKPGQVSDITGTSFLLTCLRETPLRHPDAMNVATATGGWGAFAVVDAAGDAVRWAARTLDRNNRSFEALSVEAASAPPGADGLLFMPYLTGERLGQGASSRAAFLGLNVRHGPAHLHRAIMEGVVLAMAEAYAPIARTAGAPSSIVSAAGGARSDLWLSIKADVFGCPIISPEEPEAGLVGAACIGLAGLGHFKTPAEAASVLVRHRPAILPDPVRQARYAEVAASFAGIRRLMPDLNAQLEKLA